MELNRYLKLLSVTCAVWVLVSCLTGAAALAAPGQSAESLFQQGNSLYGKGQYQEALDIYTRIIAEEGYSGPLLYNLANCYAQMGQSGLAILNYERVLRLSPRDSDSKGNMELLRKNLSIFQDELPWSQRMVSMLSLDQWTLASGLFLIAFTLVNLAGLGLSTGKRAQVWIGGGCLFCMVIASVGTFFQYRHQGAAIVTHSNARLLLSPFSSAAPVGTIQEGRMVQRTARHGQFSLVEGPSGRTGWIETEAISSITAGD